MSISARALVTVTAAAVLATGAAPAEAAGKKPVKYANCTALQKVHPHGVGRKGAKDKVSGRSKPVTTFTVDTATYERNTGLDRDKDGIACEKR